MQQIPTFAGIDISKLSLDICLSEAGSSKYFKIKNEADAIKTFFSALTGRSGNLYIGMENTGCYNYPLYHALSELELQFYVIPPMHLKKSIGLTRGKNDKIDSARIAMFLETNLQKLSVYRPQRAVIAQLQLLLTTRSQRIKIAKQLAGGSEQYQYRATQDCKELLALDNELIKTIGQQVKVIEAEIQKLISSDAKLLLTYKLISSVQGVGKVLSWNLLVRTGEFENITTPRKLACYAGVVPFEHSSGTSIRGKRRGSPLADKGLKMLLHLAALSAIRLPGDLKDYYQRKVAEGKNKMSALNAVRNKIVHRVYAVLKHQRPYQKYLANPLVMS